MFDFSRFRIWVFAGLVALATGCASRPEPFYPDQTSDPSLTSHGTLPFLPRVKLCRSLNVSNPPARDTSGYVHFSPFFAVDDKVVLSTTPFQAGCLSSGFGFRSGRRHKGIDFANPRPVEIYTGGQGRIVEATTHRDFGNYVLVYHGWNVYTRYAHLEVISPEIQRGKIVHMGETLGLMGKTGRGVTGRHLHYEVLKGNYNTPKKSFGLEALDIFSLPQMWPQ